MKKLLILLALLLIPVVASADSFDCPTISGYTINPKWNGEISFNDYKGWHTTQCSYNGSSGEVEVFAKANWVQKEGGEVIGCGAPSVEGRYYSDYKQAFILFDKTKKYESRGLIDSMIAQANELALPCDGFDDFEEEGDVQISIKGCYMDGSGECFEDTVLADPENDAVIELAKFCKKNPSDVMCKNKKDDAYFCIMSKPPECWYIESGERVKVEDYKKAQKISDGFCLPTDPPECWDVKSDKWVSADSYMRDGDGKGQTCIFSDPIKCWNTETSSWMLAKNEKTGEVEQLCLMTDPPKCWDDKQGWHYIEYDIQPKKGVFSRIWGWFAGLFK